MGKRRSLRQGGKDEPLSENEDEYEQEEKESIREDQIELIKTRKKLLAKRRTLGADGNAAPVNPFSSFGGFKGLNVTMNTTSTTNTPTATTTTQKTLSTLQSNTSQQVPKIEDAKKLISSVINEGSSSLLKATKKQQNDDQSGKSLSDTDAKFIQELSELYVKHYDTQRDYKLPSYDKTHSNKENYARMLNDLNRRCAKWISKHVDETQDQVLNLTPIFLDYFNYLIKLETEFFPTTSSSSSSDSTKKEATNGQSTATCTSSKINGTHQIPSNSDIIINKAIDVTSKQTSSVPNWDNMGLVSFKATITEQPNPSFSTNTKSQVEKKPQQSAHTFESPFSFGKKQETELKRPTFDTSITSTTTPEFSFGKRTTETTQYNQEEKKSSLGSSSLFAFQGQKSKDESLLDAKKQDDTTLPKLSGFTTTPFSFVSKKEDAVNGKKVEQQQPLPQSSLFSFGNKPNEAQSLVSSSISTSSSSGGFFSFMNKQSDKSTPSPASTLAPAAQSSGLFSQLNNNNSSTGSTFGGLKPFTGFGNQGTFGSQSTSTTGGFSFASQPAKVTTVGSEEGNGEQGTGGEDENYEPPKPEFEEVKEEGSLYTKSIKLYYFNKKENNYANRGAGNLHLKSLSNNEKTQLIIRADTSLGNILLNVNLNKSIPISKIGKKDVSILCIANPSIPTIDANEPCKFLFRTKTEEDANELLDKLNSMKK